MYLYVINLSNLLLTVFTLGTLMISADILFNLAITHNKYDDLDADQLLESVLPKQAFSPNKLLFDEAFWFIQIRKNYSIINTIPQHCYANQVHMRKSTCYLCNCVLKSNITLCHNQEMMSQVNCSVCCPTALITLRTFCDVGDQ